MYFIEVHNNNLHKWTIENNFKTFNHREILKYIKAKLSCHHIF